MRFSDLTPHGFCLAWQPGLIWLQAASDLLIAIAYYSIPAALLVFARRRRDLAFRPVFALFAAFIVACGTTHLMSVLTLWQPAYWLEGWVKAVTAGLSLGTAALLWPLLPRALALPSPASLREANAALAARVAERDRVAEQLRASEAQLRRFYARTPAPLHALSADLSVLDVSDRWLSLLGYTREEVIGHPATEFYAPEERPQVEALFARLRQGETIAHAERRLLCKSGEVREVEADFDIERDAAGGLQHVLVALTDVTARKQTEAALASSEARLRQAQKMEAVGQLTGGIAHDFNNLLTSLLGSLELLQRDAELGARAQRRIGVALEAAQRAARLTSQLLSFSRQQRLAPEGLAPDSVVDGIRALLERTLGERIALTVAVGDADPWPALADRNQLESALLNLAINARDAIEGAGQITIRIDNRHIGRAEAETISADPMTPGDYVAIAVQDDGQGMEEAVRARAFEPFFTTKPAGIGSGLGLAQVYGFARQSGGGMVLESRVGEGTIATILLPRAASAQPAPVEPPMLPLETVPPGTTVLVAEDDPLLRTTIEAALGELGYRVIATENGESALAALRGAPETALLFTDVRMTGGMDGVALALAARALRPSLPVLFATGYAEHGVLDRWPHALDLLTKPYSLREMRERVAAMLVGARTASDRLEPFDPVRLLAQQSPGA